MVTHPLVLAVSELESADTEFVTSRQTGRVTMRIRILRASSTTQEEPRIATISARKAVLYRL